MITTHRPHLSWPIKPRKYLKGTQVGARPASHPAAFSRASSNSQQPLFFCLQASNHVNNTRIDHVDQARNKVTRRGLCARARLKEMKEKRDSTFKLPFVRARRRSQRHYPPVCRGTLKCTYTH